MTDVPGPEKAFYSLAEVAEICGRPPGMVRRWVHRRQLPVVWLDETPLVPLVALRERLQRPPRIERTLRGRKRLAPAVGEPAGSTDDAANGTAV
jgi:hypothetical protein